MVRTIFFSALGPALLGFTLVVGTNVNVSNVTGEQEEVDVAIDPTSPSHLIGGSNDVVTGVPRARVYESTNGGQSWTNALLALPQGYQYSADPAITFDRHGNAYYAFVTTRSSSRSSWPRRPLAPRASALRWRFRTSRRTRSSSPPT